MELLNRNLYKNLKEHPVRVVQFGAGNFMRGFADWMIGLMNERAGFDAGVAVVQPLPTGPNQRINAQDGLYTLILQGLQDGTAHRERTVVGCIRFSVNPYEDFNAYLRLAETETVRFVLSNTTEAGIADHEGDRPEDRPPVSFPAKLTVFLYRRYRHFGGDPGKGLILIPCELIDNNGGRLRELVLGYSRRWELGASFERWLDTANVFCSSLVDRIVPGYPKESIEDIRRELGYEDSLTVVGEPYYLWVIQGPAWIQDELPAARAGLNVVFTGDLTPYQTRKVRILNGAHTLLAPVAYLMGIETVGDAVGDAAAGRFLREAIFEEIIPALGRSRELEDYAGSVLERFANPFVRHQWMSIALNAFSKYRVRVLPSVLDYMGREGRLPERLAFSLAALLALYRGRRGDEKIPLRDEVLVLEHFAKVWGHYDGSERTLRAVVTETLGNKAIWAADLNGIGGLTDAVYSYLALIETQGMKDAVKQLLEIARRHRRFL